jgi:hypothetical protein
MTRHPDLDCAACGFAYDEARAPAAAGAIREGAATFAGLLQSLPAATVGVRPSPDVWSPLEYGCHVRDVLLVQRERVLGALAVAEDEEPPWFGMWRDERVDLEGYRDSAPADVARQLVDAASLFANVLDRVGDDAWSRTVPYRFPVPAKRSLRWVAVHTLHEVRHHLGDVRPPASASS